MKIIRNQPRLISIYACEEDIKLHLYLQTSDVLYPAYDKPSKTAILTITLSRHTKVQDVETSIGRRCYDLPVKFLSYNGCILQRKKSLDSYCQDKQMDVFITVDRPHSANANYVIVHSPWRDYVFPWHKFMTASDIKHSLDHKNESGSEQETSRGEDMILFFKDK